MSASFDERLWIKWIVCQVRPNQRRPFHEAQLQWAALSNIDGFRGQIGGWADPTTACVLGLWRDQAAYAAFMLNVHDDIFERHGQAHTYVDCRPSVGPQLLSINGRAASIGSALGDAAILRIAMCTLLAGRTSHFLNEQRTVWNPAMAGETSMLGGLVGQSDSDPCAFHVATLWQKAQDHDRYARERVPDLRAHSDSGADLQALNGFRVQLEPAWLVAPTCQERA
jgi:hypothetical protein